MIFNETVIGNHPATSGYIVECLVRGPEVISTDPSVGFPSGSGRLKVQFPEFAVTGLEFQGKNLLFLPTGEEPEEKLMDNIKILESEINLEAFFSGDLNGATGLSIQNIKQVDVYTGSEANFEVDSLLFTNRVSQFPLSLVSGEPSFLVNVTDVEIESRVEENIFYKIIPTDYLTFGSVSPAASGVMFSGFETFTKITGDPFIITRSNANDVIVGRDQTVEIFTGTTIIIDNTLPLDFYAKFKMSTTGALTISGSGGAALSSSSTAFPIARDGFSLPLNKINVPENNEFAEFDISCLLDENDVRTGYLVGEL
tara:strand:- start:991 stop:1926 length:936 start_codon:yes stop_codon:yes gene_type:complete